MAEFDFIVDIHCRPYSRLYLLDSFAMDMANRRPEGFWLQVEGCPNGPSWAMAERSTDGAMLLDLGWKSFFRARHLSRGQCFVFRYDGDATFFVKIFSVDGGRVECCMESSSSSSSSYDEDEDEDEDDEDDFDQESEEEDEFDMDESD